MLRATNLCRLSKKSFGSRFSSTDKFTVSVADNGVRVASLQTNYPTATLAMVTQSGTRTESNADRGLNNAMAQMAFKGSFVGDGPEQRSQITSFLHTRTAELNGLVLAAKASREFSYNTVSGLNESLDTMLLLSGKSFALPSLNPWEVEECLKELQSNANFSIEQVVLDNLISASFKGGLANSLNVEASRYGNLGMEKFYNYLETCRTKENVAIVGIGIEHQKLEEFSKELDALGTGKPILTKTSFVGREIRVDINGPDSHTALGFDCSTLNHVQGVLQFAVQRALQNTGATTFIEDFSDASLLGVYTKSRGSENNLNEIYSALRKIGSQGLNAELIESGKKKYLTYLKGLHGEELLETLIKNVCFGKTESIADVCQSVESLSTGEINEAAKKVFSGPVSVSSVGNLDNIPYVDTL